MTFHRKLRSSRHRFWNSPVRMRWRRSVSKTARRFIRHAFSWHSVLRKEAILHGNLVSGLRMSGSSSTNRWIPVSLASSPQETVSAGSCRFLLQSVKERRPRFPVSNICGLNFDYRGSRQGLVQARTWTRCLHKISGRILICKVRYSVTHFLLQYFYSAKTAASESLRIAAVLLSFEHFIFFNYF